MAIDSGIVCIAFVEARRAVAYLDHAIAVDVARLVGFGQARIRVDPCPVILLPHRFVRLAPIFGCIGPRLPIDRALHPKLDQVTNLLDALRSQPRAVVVEELLARDVDGVEPIDECVRRLVLLRDDQLHLAVVARCDDRTARAITSLDLLNQTVGILRARRIGFGKVPERGRRRVPRSGKHGGEQLGVQVALIVGKGALDFDSVFAQPPPR